MRASERGVVWHHAWETWYSLGVALGLSKEAAGADRWRAKDLDETECHVSAQTTHLQAYEARELPAYPLTEAARYLRMSRATLNTWVHGRFYPTERGRAFFHPLIALPDPERRVLSFVNMIEAHVLSAIRKDHGVALPKVRKALDYVAKNLRVRKPLADQRFLTDGVDLFIEYLDRDLSRNHVAYAGTAVAYEFLNVSQQGQLTLREMMVNRLRRIDHNTAGIPIRLYPFTRRGESDQPKMIVMDPDVSFGRPVLAGTSITTAILAERYKAGESMDALAEDYGRSRDEIEEAVRCELPAEAA